MRKEREKRMEKTIVTHVNPDLDAITAIWLLVRFAGEEYKGAGVEFVPAGERLENENNNTIHVDTGLGKFDHHQPEKGEEDTSATKLVYEWLVNEKKIEKREELDRIVEFVTDIDHFREYFWPEPTSDRYLFCIEHVLQGIKMGGYVKNDKELVEFGMKALDGIYISFKVRKKAERDIKKGIVIETKWGKALGVESSNGGLSKLALKKGFKLVVRKDIETGSVRIKAAPEEGIDLSLVYKKILEMDPEATWYFHPSRKMVLNGSIRNPKMVPSKLNLSEVIDILKTER